MTKINQENKKRVEAEKYEVEINETTKSKRDKG